MFRKIITAAASAALLAALISPSQAFNAGEAETTASWLNFRSEPSSGSEVISLVPQGSKVEILADLGEWCRVRYDGKEGYMSSQYLRQELPEPTEPTAPESTPEPSSEPVETPLEEPVAEAELPPAAEPEASAAEELELSQTVSGTVTGDGVRFRAAPSLDGDVYGYFYKGSPVTVLAQEGDWYQVESLGKTGYVSKQYISVREPADPAVRSAEAEKILELAEANLDAPYVYGGDDPDIGFDCSGFVYYCFRQSGYSMNRTASQQYRQGVFVEKASLEPGDLVFFAGPAGWEIEHVGIYLGGGEFIHASTGSRSVVITELDNSYFSRYYYGARRILD